MAGLCQPPNSFRWPLVDLSNTFLRYLLLPFKGNRTNADFPSEIATPTFDEQSSYSLDSLDANRDSNMTKLVRLREGYQCLITGIYHKAVGSLSVDLASLENCHIIKRAVGVFDPEKDQGSLATWDILRHYIGWDEKRTQDVLKKLDTPLNGMLLHQSFHDAWERFAWTLQPVVDTDGIVNDTYDIEVIRPREFHRFNPATGLPVNLRITFRDRGTEPAVQELIREDDFKVQTWARPLPDPELIALHRALCRVLHMSGAAEVIDSVFRDLGKTSVEVPSSKIRTADELAMLISLSLHQTA